MLKKLIKVVLPRHLNSEDRLFHLALPERALHTTHNQTICYSQAGTIRNIVPAGTPERHQLEEYTFAQVLSPDAASFFKEPINLDALKGLCVVLFGDNSRLKEELICPKQNTNNIVKELMNNIAYYSSTIEVSATLFGSSSRCSSDNKKALIGSYVEFTRFYERLIDNVGETDMAAYNLSLKFEFTSKGQTIQLKLLRLVDNMSECDLQDVLNLKRGSEAAKHIGSAQSVVFYWCPDPTKKCHRLLKMLEAEHQASSDLAGFSERSSSHSKIRTDTQVSQKLNKKSKGKKTNRSNLTPKSKEREKVERVERPDKQRSSFRRDILKNVENQVNSKLEVKGKIMDIIVQDKNKRIQTLETSLQEKDRYIKQLEGKFNRLQGEKDRMDCECSEYEKRVGELLKQIASLRSETERQSSKVVNTEQRIAQYECQVQHLHNDIKQTLQKLNGKNHKLKEQVAKLKKQLVQSKKCEEQRIRKYERLITETQQKQSAKLLKLNEHHEQTIQSLKEQISVQKQRLDEVSGRNQQLLDDNGKLNKEIKDCYGGLIEAQHKYGELCMKLRSLAHFKDSEVLTLNTIIDSL